MVQRNEIGMGMSQTIVLGKGYVGTNYCKKFPNVLATSRKSNSQDDTIYFELTNKDSWKNLPVCENIIWTFSVAESEEESQYAKEFFSYYCLNKKILILSTISAYIHAYDNEIIDENTPLDYAKLRIKTEEELRLQGAYIVHLAGIFGPNRLPKNWFIQGRVQDPDGIINLIHVDDIVYCINILLEKFKAKSRINICNGFYKKNSEVVNELKEKKEIDLNFSFPTTYIKKMNKKVSNKKLQDELLPDGYQFKSYPE
ncbi:hypothetical protein [Fluviispira vulneris]|uniref:hypothetical protein n=1 Tax=Fluviispira vulneris TaxID=2763012 RepID=UPI0016452CC3|nr:hypothetical protein [Fluviispira vulneris]